MQMRTRVIALAAAAAVAGCATAGTGPNFHTMDQDNSACLDRTEFALSAIFDGWDADLDGVVAESEFESGAGIYAGFDALDTDADDRIAPGEIGTDVELGEWDRWDLDDSGDLESDEFHAGLFAVWDADEDDFITMDEAEAGMFGLWDADRNGCLDRNEYGTAFSVLR